jgi:hypothetical protein
MVPASFCACKQWVGRGQPWFYLRLATKRGTIALLGCPREHTVPRETLRLNPRRHLASNPSAQRPPDPATKIETMAPRSDVLCALKLLVASNVRPGTFPFLPDIQRDGSDLARQRQARHLRPHALGQQL